MPGSRGALAAPPHALPGLPPRLLAPAHANRLRFSLIRALPPPQPRLPPRYRARAVALEASPNARTTTPPHATPAACALAVALAVTPTTDRVADALAAAPRRHAHRLAALPPCCHARRCMCSSRSPPRRRARCLTTARAAALGRRRTAAHAASRSRRPRPPCGRLLHRRFPHRQSLHRPPATMWTLRRPVPSGVAQRPSLCHRPVPTRRHLRPLPSSSSSATGGGGRSV